MDGRRFDDLVKAAVDGAPTRRGMLKGLAGGTAAAVLARFGAERAAAGPASPAGADDGSCRRKNAIGNSGRCVGDTCGGRRSCGCANDVDGKKQCVNFLVARCPGRDECDGNDDCRPREVCVQLGACCGNLRFNACIPECGTQEVDPDGKARVPAPFAAALRGA